MKLRPCNIILDCRSQQSPSSRELSAAKIIAHYLQSDIYIVPCSNRKTPDFQINDVLWELKTPTGNGKYNIQHALRAALSQSQYIIVDVRFSKKHINKIKSELKYQLRKTKEIKRLLLITKSAKVIEIIR